MEQTRPRPLAVADDTVGNFSLLGRPWVRRVAGSAFALAVMADTSGLGALALGEAVRRFFDTQLDSIETYLKSAQAEIDGHKAVAKVTDDEDELLAFYDYPAEHWIHLRTTNPIESTFATVRLRTKATKGHGSKAAALAMAFKLIESVHRRWQTVNAPHLVALVRAGATFVNGKLVERPGDQSPSAAEPAPPTSEEDVA